MLYLRCHSAYTGVYSSGEILHTVQCSQSHFLALHPQKHGTDVKSSLTLKSLLSFWSILLLDLLEYFRLCPFFPSSWWLSPERLVFTDITTEFLCIYHSQSIYFKFIFDFSRSLGITFVDVMEELRIVMNKSTEIKKKRIGKIEMILARFIVNSRTGWNFIA